MRNIAILSALALLGGIANVAAEIPYVVKNGFEEVDYDKLNPIEGFKLPDSGQFRDSTWVHGEDADYVRNPPSFTLMHDDEITYDNNTKLMWERNLNFRGKQVVPPKGEPEAKLTGPLISTYPTSRASAVRCARFKSLVTMTAASP